MTTTQELMKARFAEVQAEVEAIRQRTAKPRKELAALVEKHAAMRPEMDRLAAEVHVHDAELAAKKRELAKLARALGGKSLSEG